MSHPYNSFSSVFRAIQGRAHRVACRTIGRWRIATARRQLYSLDDHMLHDIGLTRSRVEEMARLVHGCTAKGGSCTCEGN